MGRWIGSAIKRVFQNVIGVNQKLACRPSVVNQVEYYPGLINLAGSVLGGA